MRDNNLKTKRWQKPLDVFDSIENELFFTIKYVKKRTFTYVCQLATGGGHSDPFDRMIIAQSITERIPLISSDTKFHHYRKQELDFIFNNK
jgi:PIN domain nuclease of toxin-antitoxin system